MDKQKDIKNVISTISHILDTKVKWLIGGSGALLVHGLDVAPNDIDLIIDNDDYEMACQLLSKYLTSTPKPHGNTTKTAYRVNSIEGELLMYPIAKKNIEYREINGQQIPVNKLELEYKYYKARTDKNEATTRKLKLIEQELKRRSSQG